MGSLDMVMRLDCRVVIQVVKVREVRGKGFVIDYEYVHESLRNSVRIKDPAFAGEFKCEIY